MVLEMFETFDKSWQYTGWTVSQNLMNFIKGMVGLKYLILRVFNLVEESINFIFKVFFFPSQDVAQWQSASMYKALGLIPA